MKHSQCPACRSFHTKETLLFGRSGVQAFKNRRCCDCGTAWRPPTPKWLAIVVIVLGLLLPLLLSAVDRKSNEMFAATGRPSQTFPGNWIPFAFGGFAVAAGMSVLFGKIGKLKILGKVEADRK
jgi:hypothetical protein